MLAFLYILETARERSALLQILPAFPAQILNYAFADYNMKITVTHAICGLALFALLQFDSVIFLHLKF